MGDATGRARGARSLFNRLPRLLRGVGRSRRQVAALSAEWSDVDSQLVAMDHVAAKGDDRLRQDGKPP